MWQPNNENSIPWASDLYPVGVQGGIPDWPQFCDVTQAPYLADRTGANDCAAAINQALHDCPQRAAVFLPPGKYLLANPITFGDPVYAKVQNKVLRGSGIGQTVLIDRCNAVAVISLGSDLSWTTPRKVSVFGTPIAKGEDHFELTAPTSFSVGQIGYLDEDNDNEEFGTPVTGMPNGQTQRLHRQTVQITAINGPEITISPAAAWDFTRAPAFNDFGCLNGSSDYAVRNCGLEDLSLDRSQSDATISVMIIQAIGCWLKNVESSKAPSYHFHCQDSLFSEFRGCIAADTQGTIGPNQGGLLLYRRACSCLIEDCTFDRTFPGIEISSGSCANVVAYCYIRRNTGSGGTMQGAAIDTCHGSHTGLNLVEGCISANVEADGYYGSASRDTIFRTWAHGQNEEGVTEGSKCISLCRWSTKMTVADCVLGMEGVPAIYEAQASGYPYSEAVIWRLGYPNMGNNGWSGEIPPLEAVSNPGARDRRVEQSLKRIGNYDYVTQAIDDPSAGDFPASLYLRAKPEWFGNLPWPPIGAELAAIGMIPAQARYEGLAFPYTQAPPQPEPDQPWLTTPDGEPADWVEVKIKGTKIRWLWGAAGP